MNSNNKIIEFPEPLLDNLDTIDRNAVIERYVTFAPVYNYSVHKWGYKAPELCARLLNQHTSSRNIRILDAGCGTGLVGKALTELSYTDITGIDLSPDMLSIASVTKYYQRLDQHDLTVIPYPYDENSFHAILCIGVLSLISDPLPVFTEFHRLLQSDGYMIFTQRDNLYTKYNYDAILKQLELKKLIQLIMMSEPTNYLPDRDNFSHRKLITFIYKILK